MRTRACPVTIPRASTPSDAALSMTDPHAASRWRAAAAPTPDDTSGPASVHAAAAESAKLRPASGGRGHQRIADASAVPIDGPVTRVAPAVGTFDEVTRQVPAAGRVAGELDDDGTWVASDLLEPGTDYS